MSDNSLFASLLRQPAWVSFAVAGGVILAGFYLVPEKYAFIAWSFALPFLVTGVMVIWKRKDIPSDARIERTVEAVSAMSWREFSALLEQAYQREGYVVTRVDGAADLQLAKGNRISLVSCKRWKAVSQGLEPLRELYAARKAQEAREAIYICVGKLTDNARSFAEERRIVLVEAEGLTALLRLPKKPAKPAA